MNRHAVMGRLRDSPGEEAGMKIAAAILCGGRASRLGGTPKGLLRDAAEMPIIQGLLSGFTQVGIGEVVLSVNHHAEAYAPLRRLMVRDEHQNCGPLGGIQAILGHFSGRCDSVFFVPCDMPCFAASHMIELLDAHYREPTRITMAATAEGVHPLCAVVSVAVRPAISLAIQRGQYSVGRLWRELGAAAVVFDDSEDFLNINTPGELDRWRNGQLKDARGARS
jgi:molybdenum cofactor guanylyltransferase